jgi:hypothetical protein
MAMSPLGKGAIWQSILAETYHSCPVSRDPYASSVEDVVLTLQRYLMEYLVKAPFPVREIGPVLTLLHACYVP